MSDAHLGEYVKEHARIEYMKRMPEMDRDLCDFLEYYASHREDGKPWRLIINGDFMDFLTLTITPSTSTQKRLPRLQLDDDERRYGLDNEEEKAAWKIERIAERHGVLFTYLADFVGRGHRLEFIFGNHDIELYWPNAQQTMSDRLVEMYFGSEDVAGQTEEEYRSRIVFLPWFIYSEGRYLIDHGNQYDDFTSFENRLYPVLPFDPTELAMPVSHFAIRYFVNQFKGFRSHDKDTWTMWDAIKWMGQQGWHEFGFVIKSYFLLTRRILAYHFKIKRADASGIEELHRRRVRTLGEEYGLSEDKLNKICTLERPTIQSTLGRTLQATAIDRCGLVMAAVLFYLVAVLVPGWWFTAVGLMLLTLLVVFYRHVLKAIRNHLLGGEVLPGATAKLEQAGCELARLLDVRYVIFGHSHRPSSRFVPGTSAGRYLNEGCWLPPQVKERHQDGCRSPLTYCRILERVVPHARLLRWCQRSSCPEPFRASLPAEIEPPEVVIRFVASNGDTAGTGPTRRVAVRSARPHEREQPSPRRSLRKQRY